MKVLVPDVYPGKFSDPEPWGKAFSVSVFTHGILLLLLLLSLHKKAPVRPMLLDVNFIEFKAPVVTGPEKVVGGRGGGGGEAKGGGGTSLGPSKNSGYVQSHPNLPKLAPISSEVGTPEGEVVVSQPMTGPIVSLDQFGMVGKKKGALMPFASQTSGRPGKGASLPPALKGEKGGEGTQIVLARQNLDDIRRTESNLGVPLISEKVVVDASGEKIKRLAEVNLGQTHKASAESLKANPLDKEKWGNKKGPFSMEGPLKYRKILKMQLPPYPRWAEEQGVEASVSFRLWVDVKGHVKDNMYLEKTSGYNELDYLAKDALMKFIFVPLPGNQDQEDEWGVATFRFELTK